MARRRKLQSKDLTKPQVPDTMQEQTPDTTEVSNKQGEYRMSVFETLSREEWVNMGAGSSARKGEYGEILVELANSGQRYALINTDATNGGRFGGRKASAVATALKQARDSKNAPAGVDKIQISSKSEKGADGIGLVFLENEAVEA